MPRRTTLPLLAAAACGAAFLAVWLVFFGTASGRSADLRVTVDLSSFFYYRQELIAPLDVVSHLCDPGPYALLVVGVLVLAWSVRGPWTALVLGVTVAVPNVVGQLLKTALASDRGGGAFIANVDAAAWPSGHATAAVALAGAAVIAAPAALRVVVGLGGAIFALAMGFVVVALGWHFASDVLGGYALAGACVALGAAALGLSPRAATTAPRTRWRPARG